MLIAVDVAILPPPPVAEIALKLSRSLPPAQSQGLRLDDTHLPHITLTQQFVERTNLPDVLQTIGTVVARRPVLRLQVVGPGGGANSVWMQIARSQALDELHGALMDALLPFERANGDASAFHGGDARPRDIEWVSQYRSNSSYAQFTPHITVGHSSTLPRVEPLLFDAELIALCHLGRFCTCREPLRSWTLSSSATAGADSPDTRHPSA